MKMRRKRHIASGKLNGNKKGRLTYGTVAAQLSKKNTHFQFKLIKSGVRAVEYENAMQWLVSANLFSAIPRGTD